MPCSAIHDMAWPTFPDSSVTFTGLLNSKHHLDLSKTCHTVAPTSALTSAISLALLPSCFCWAKPHFFSQPKCHLQQEVSLTSGSEECSFCFLGHHGYTAGFILTLCKCLGDRDGILFLTVGLVPCSVMEMLCNFG